MNPSDPQPQQPQQPPQPNYPQPEYQQPNQDPTRQGRNPLSAMQDGEKTLFDIHRHPIGLIGVYFMGGLLMALVGAFAVLAPSMLTDYDKTTVTNFSLALFLIAAVFTMLFVFIAHVVYYGNRWILTTDSLTQIVQTSLFNKQSSQLGLDNLEDVTVEQNGILAHLLNYGVLKAQTAGEHGKFQFNYCRNPNEHAQKILIARENFEHGNVYNQPTANN